MPYSVLIVDDSRFFQARLKGVVNEHPNLNVVGVASNGQEAIDMAAKLKPDVISMDYEMPFLDGLSAVRIIMAENPCPIVMFSSMTYEGAKITLDALEAGAVDFINKNFAEVSGNSLSFKKKLHEKLILFASNGKPGVPAGLAPRTSAITTKSVLSSASPGGKTAAPSANNSPITKVVAKKIKGKVKLLAIGASTGGPVALADIISALPADFPVPVIIVQHMPENFTRVFSERLNRQSALRVKEAEHGDRLEKGLVLVAPGGKQMMLDRSGSSIKIMDSDDRVNYRPCVDITFASAAVAMCDGVLGVILTGMGADGCEGSRMLKEKGSTIWSQDKDSCVVYGMPAAVARANITSCVLPLKDIAKKLISDV
ncbi:MAG: two-component system chemotaxis response regulator CheB [Lentisphaeria bacterium]